MKLSVRFGFFLCISENLEKTFLKFNLSELKKADFRGIYERSFLCSFFQVVLFHRRSCILIVVVLHKEGKTVLSVHTKL